MSLDKAFKTVGSLFLPVYTVITLRGTSLCHALKSIFKPVTDLSIEINRIDSHISLDQNWFSRIKLVICSF
jgi:hypothetical protein